MTRLSIIATVKPQPLGITRLQHDAILYCCNYPTVIMKRASGHYENCL
jgi:hypothetical protein